MYCELLPEKCIACGLCQVAAPSYFDYDEEGIVLFKDEPHAQHQFVSAEQEPAVKRAAKKCPVRAILVETAH